LDYLVKAICWF